MIGFISSHHCMRVVKEAYALRYAGFQIHSLSKKFRDTGCYHSMSVYNSKSTFINTMELLADKIDIWHAHNEPNWFYPVIKRTLPDSLLIMDYHDSNYWRYGMIKNDMGETIRWYQEDTAVQICDGFVVPSPACKAELETRTDKPIAIVPSALPLSDYYEDVLPYEGGLAVDGAHHLASINPLFGWRDYTKLYTELSPKCNIYAYAPNWEEKLDDPITSAYSKTGAQLRKCEYGELLRSLGRHTWGLVGNLGNAKVWEVALPNKLFEYIAAGVPIVAMRCKQAQEFVRKYDIGICVETPEELLARWDEHIEKRKNLMMIRHRFSMENYIGVLIDLYETVKERRTKNEKNDSGNGGTDVGIVSRVRRSRKARTDGCPAVCDAESDVLGAGIAHPEGGGKEPTA